MLSVNKVPVDVPFIRQSAMFSLARWLLVFPTVFCGVFPAQLPLSLLNVGQVVQVAALVIEENVLTGHSVRAQLPAIEECPRPTVVIAAQFPGAHLPAIQELWFAEHQPSPTDDHSPAGQQVQLRSEFCLLPAAHPQASK
jgi:hypothetical protein